MSGEMLRICHIIKARSLHVRGLEPPRTSVLPSRVYFTELLLRAIKMKREQWRPAGFSLSPLLCNPSYAQSSGPQSDTHYTAGPLELYWRWAKSWPDSASGCSSWTPSFSWFPHLPPVPPRWRDFADWWTVTWNVEADPKSPCSWRREGLMRPSELSLGWSSSRCLLWPGRPTTKRKTGSCKALVMLPCVWPVRFCLWSFVPSATGHMRSSSREFDCLQL